MNEEAKRQFHSKINFIPPWAKDYDRLANYARHCCFRMYQKQVRIDSLMNYLATFHPGIIDELENNMHLINAHFDELNDEYNKEYNSKARLEDIIGESE